MDMFVLARDGSPCPPEPSRGGIGTDGEILSWNAGQMEEWMTGKVFSFLFFCSEARFGRKEMKEPGEGVSHLLRSCLVNQQKMLFSIKSSIL